MDFFELTILLLMLPANKGQYVQSIRAMGKAIFQNATGIVPFLKVETPRIQATLVFSGNEDWPFHSLNGFP